MARGQETNSIVVVGGGAAGIVAAWRAATLGAAVTLLEKNDRLGMKILISGGGKCNVTHDGDIETLCAGFRTNEARFLKPSFYRFSNHAFLGLLEGRGIRFQARADGKIFPVNATARDVVAALASVLDESGVQVRLRTPVSRLEFDGLYEGQGAGKPGLCAAGVRIPDGTLACRHVVLCVGGSSYPGTGATGDGWPWAVDAGHTIVKVRAALAPLFLELAHAEWSGVAIRDCTLHARQDGRRFTSWRGDLLFTHRGISGPCALGISRDVAERRPRGPVSLEVDLLPANPPDQVSADVREWIRLNPRNLLSSFVTPFLPERLVAPFLEDAGCDVSVRAAHLPQKARNTLAQFLKGWPIGFVQHVPLEKGEVVAGGVSLDEVDPRTMRSRKARGLYLCGEILDIAGAIGGYNLQAAWSTGYVAGETAAEKALST